MFNHLQCRPSEFKLFGPVTLAEAMHYGVTYIAKRDQFAEKFDLNGRTIQALGYIPRPEIACVVFEMQQNHLDDCESQRLHAQHRAQTLCQRHHQHA